MGFRLQQDGLMVKYKANEKSLRDHISFLLTLLFLHFTIRGLFASEAKKKSCFLLDMSYLFTAVCVCVFSHRHIQFETYT